ncbi:hypothetical protein EDB87DRAFT_1577812 [Lactarius vividus]|nr:hypothetical protein EDB87DRAFT_1577812 [Lactarius vividus]
MPTAAWESTLPTTASESVVISYMNELLAESCIMFSASDLQLRATLEQVNGRVKTADICAPRAKNSRGQSVDVNPSRPYLSNLKQSEGARDPALTIFASWGNRQHHPKRSTVWLRATTVKYLAQTPQEVHVFGGTDLSDPTCSTGGDNHPDIPCDSFFRRRHVTTADVACILACLTRSWDPPIHHPLAIYMRTCQSSCPHLVLSARTYGVSQLSRGWPDQQGDRSYRASDTANTACCIGYPGATIRRGNGSKRQSYMYSTTVRVLSVSSRFASIPAQALVVNVALEPTHLHMELLHFAIAPWGCNLLPGLSKRYQTIPWHTVTITAAMTVRYGSMN